ncbi:MAG: leucine-rich repeat domain-containing protein [Synergistaceae bacterium]|nr:leucine-rich repeat domain-containing protein [Synergistaceae bacterium]
MEKLRVLSLDGNPISNFEPLAFLREIEGLSLANIGISDLSWARRMFGLKILDLRDNKITDASPLYDLQGLDDLDLRGNPIMAGDVEKLRKLLSNTGILF